MTGEGSQVPYRMPRTDQVCEAAENATKVLAGEVVGMATKVRVEGE